MKILKRVISILLTAALLSNISVFAEEISPSKPLDCSDWARDELEEALEIGFIPENMQSDYTSNITRAEFAAAALHFLAVQYGTTVDEVMKHSVISYEDIRDERFNESGYKIPFLKM